VTIANNQRKKIYVGNGAATAWPFSFKAFVESDVEVYITDANGVDTKLTTGYRVSLNTGAGGEVTYPYPTTGAKLTASEKISIARDVPLSQEVDLVDQGPLFAEVLEEALDRVTVINQQQQEKLDRALVIPLSNEGIDVNLPSPVSLHSFRWNVEANKLETTLDPASVVDAAIIEKLAAQTARVGAEAARDAAETAEDNINATIDAAVLAATVEATTQAGISTTKATEATEKAVIATEQATNAGNSATLAIQSAQLIADYNYATYATMTADLVPAASKRALVYNDTTVVGGVTGYYNGMYIKQGATGTGSWQKVISPPLAAKSVSLNSLALDMSNSLNKRVVGIKSKNIFDMTDIISGKYISNSNGLEVVNASLSASNYIAIDPSTYYAVSGTSEQCAFYDSNKSYISGVTASSTPFQSPSNAAYIRLSMLNTQISILQLEKNNVKTTYEPFSPKIDLTTIRDVIPESKLDTKLIRGIISKNLFNLSDIVSGKYISNSNGLEAVNASLSASNYIAIDPSTYYAVSGTTEQCAFYDSNKVYISGLTSTYTPFQSPATAAYIRMSMLNTQISTVQLEQGNVKTTYESYGAKFDLTTIRDVIPESKLDKSLIRGTYGKNLFNKTVITTGKYVSNSNGNLAVLTGINASDYIAVTAGEKYSLSGTTEQGAFYDSNKVYVSGFTGWGNVANSQIPVGVFYIRLSMLDAQINSVQLEKGNTVTSYEAYGYYLTPSGITGFTATKVNNITVDINGSGDYTNLSNAIAIITDSSKNNIYNIYIKASTYDVFSTLTPAELAANGILLPDYVNLIGIGNVTLKGEIPSGQATLDNTTRIATINVKRNNNLIGLKITARNMRYAVHDESSNSIKDWTRVVENCEFTHFGNDAGMWQWTSAYGEGCSSGSDSRFKNCKFTDYTTNPAYGVHNNINFDKPSYHEFDICDFTNLVNGGTAFRLGSMGSGQVDKVVLKGCRFTGKVLLFEELSNGCGIDFTVEGYSNDSPAYSFQYSNANNFVQNLAFSDEVVNGLNLTGSTITRKSLVKMTGINQVSPLLSGDSTVMFYGIALEDIVTGESGKIRTKGYVRIADTNLSSVNVGDKIGIANGALTIVTNGDYIGVCTIAGFIKLK